MRNKKTYSKQVTLKNEQGTTSVIKAADLDVLGGNFREITDETKKNLNITYGIEVIKVNKGKLQQAGISRGFIIQTINDQTVKTLDQASEDC